MAAMAGGGNGLGTAGAGIAATAGGGNGFGTAGAGIAATAGGGNGLGTAGAGIAAAIAAGGVGRLLTSGAGMAALARAADDTKETATMNLNELRGRVRIFCSLRGGVDTSPKNNCRASVPQKGKSC
jgi:hypothetical protein